MENCTGLKPILDDVDEAAADPLRRLAEKYFHLPCSVMTPNDRRLEIAAPAGRRVPPGVRHRADLAGMPDLRRRVAPRAAAGRGGIGLPYLRIETDYSPSDSARIAVRVEALLETVRAGRAAAELSRTA